MGTIPKQNPSLDSRVARLEAVIPNLATKADLSDAKVDIIKWSAGMAISSAAIVVATLGLIISRTYPAPAAPQQPLAAPIIVLPQPAPTAAPEPSRSDK